jgi:hypothetical protein
MVFHPCLAAQEDEKSEKVLQQHSAQLDARLGSDGDQVVVSVKEKHASLACPANPTQTSARPSDTVKRTITMPNYNSGDHPLQTTGLALYMLALIFFSV